ncbi:hypothetical protein AGLY_006652, partial [Aphis glycines]
MNFPMDNKSTSIDKDYSDVLYTKDSKSMIKCLKLRPMGYEDYGNYLKAKRIPLTTVAGFHLVSVSQILERVRSNMYSPVRQTTVFKVTKKAIDLTRVFHHFPFDSPKSRRLTTRRTAIYKVPGRRSGHDPNPYEFLSCTLIGQTSETAYVREQNATIIPDILVLLYINLVEHAVMTFTRDVGLHFHSDMAGHQSRLDALSSLQECLSFRHFIWVMHHNTSHTNTNVGTVTAWDLVSTPKDNSISRKVASTTILTYLGTLNLSLIVGKNYCYGHTRKQYTEQHQQMDHVALVGTQKISLVEHFHLLIKITH